MDEQVEGSLGLDVLCLGSSPTVECVVYFANIRVSMLIWNVSIVAVHGLGANPKWAWVRKVKVQATGEEKKVNWLADNDLLSKMVPNARIMTFNYESKWHADAPKQRRSLCAEQLLTALDNQRDKARTIVPNRRATANPKRNRRILKLDR